MENNNNHIVLNPTKWFHLWSSFGFTDYQWKSRIDKIEEYTRKIIEYKFFIYEQRLIKRREFLKQTLNDYYEILQRTGLSSSIDKIFFENLKLKDQEIYLDDKMNELLINEDQLIQKRIYLENKEKSLCNLLHITTIEYYQTDSIIKINEKLQDHIQLLNQLKTQRLIQISSYYIKLKDYSQRLEWTPSILTSSTIEYLLLEQFDQCLTIDNLNEIEQTINELENQINIQKKYFRTLYHQLTHLYECLHKDHCLTYKNDDENINVFIIKQLENEIEYCREERMKNGKEYCRLIREKINDLLNKLHLDINQHQIIQRLDFEILSLDLLDAYDNEYQRLKQLYEKRKPVLDAYEKWHSFWKEYLAFIKSSTDPGRFHIRGYNADIEGKQRKKYQRDLLIIENEFLKILSEENNSKFLYDNIPIRQLFDEAHQQILSITKPNNNTPIRRLGLTPVTTPRRVMNKEPFVVSTTKRVVKTPANNVARKLLSKPMSHTNAHLIHVKSRAPASIVKSTVTPQIDAELPIHSSTNTGDQSLDFSLLHTVKNVYGQMKILTSTPNSSFIYKIKTSHNIIDERKSKRRSKRTPFPRLTVQHSDDETLICL